MAISDSPERQTQRGTRIRSVEKTGKWWSDAQKLEAVKTYLMTGNLAMTARILKIPEDTIRHWRKSSWWAEVNSELALQDELVLSARLQKIVEKSLDVIDDRLEHGDFVYDQKTGQMRRKPVNMRDVAKLTQDSLARRDIINGRAQTGTSLEATADKLKALAQKFEELASGKRVLESNIVEGEIVDVSEKAEETQIPPVPSDVPDVHWGDGAEETLPQEEDPGPGPV